MNILGVNVSNNGAVCVLKDGDLDLYLESERITRKKMDCQVKATLDYIDDEIDVVALVDAHWSAPDKKMMSARDIAAIKRAYPDAKRIDFRDRHHLTHAACGFYRSDFEEAAVIVVDSNGSDRSDGSDKMNPMMETETIMHCKTGRRFHWKAVHKKYWDKDDRGIGKLFEEVSLHCGFGADDAGKVMGLSAYGNQMVDLYELKDNVSKEDSAYTIQTMWEQRAEELVNIAVKKTKCKNIVLVGGCFLNCVVNYRLVKEFPDLNFYAEPIAHDGGTSIGAAYLVHHNPKVKDY